MIRLLAVLLLASPAAAKDFPVTDEDQRAIVVMCQMAVKSPAVDIDTTASLANWCLQWRGRMRAADAPPLPPTEKPAEPPK